jgi:hypothetical protein
MKTDLKSIDLTQFMVHEHTINGEVVYLVQPQHIGANFTQANKYFRSSVWNTSGELVSAAFPKFVNWGENPDNFPVPKSLKGTTLTEKIDGCCDGNIILITEDGNKTIKEICETKYKGKVTGYNHALDKEEMTSVISHSIQDNNQDWYELEFETGKIILTGNHLVYLPELKCYRRVDQLKGDEKIMLKK